MPKHSSSWSAYEAKLSGSAIDPADILAFHRSQFGDFRMEGDEPDPKPDPEPKIDSDPGKGDPDQLGDAGKRALSAEREARQKAEKAAADALARVKQLEDADLSEKEKAEKERDEYRTSSESSRALLDRYEAAEEAGLPLSWAKRLTGSTKDEIVVDAKQVKADLDAQGKRSGNPKPDPSQGQGSDSGKSAGSVAAGRDLYAERHPAKK